LKEEIVREVFESICCGIGTLKLMLDGYGEERRA